MNARLATNRAPLVIEAAAKHRTIIFVCNVGWFFISHRLVLAQAAKAHGYEVHVACDIDDAFEAEALEKAGLKFHRIRLSRGGLNPFRDLHTLFSLVALFIKYRPRLVHNISIKPVLYGSIAARMTSVRGVVNAVSGLGYLFTDTHRAGFIRQLARFLYRFALRSRAVRVIFQNKDDQQIFVNGGLVRFEQTMLIAGSGVSLDSYIVTPEPDESVIRIVFPARMLRDKGVFEFAAAAGQLKRNGFQVECVMAGALDMANPAALSAATVRNLEAEGAVKWLGNVSDMPQLLKESHIVCLPSYREGLPKALIEACAAGRPIVTTAVPGCRDVVSEGINGLLVPARDADALYTALVKLVTDKDLRKKMGARGRQIAERDFGIEQVIERTLRLYADLAS